VKCVVLIPWRGGDNRREYLWDLTRYWLEKLDWPIFTGDFVDGRNSNEFNRGGSINTAAREAGDWDVALIGDADTYQDPDAAYAAAEIAASSGDLVVPWSERLKLSNIGTEIFGKLGPTQVFLRHRDVTDKTSRDGGGATIIVPRSAWDVVGGFDESHLGYGNEDLAFMAAIETLVAKPTRVQGRALHLWHPTRKGVGTLKAATRPNQELWDRYRAARGDARAMRALLDERDETRASV
jgi:hypothetical protein